MLSPPLFLPPRSHPKQAEPKAGLSLDDCPILPPGATLPLTAPDGSTITLERLEGPNWWQLLPAPYSSTWRRQAGDGRSHLFTPHLNDLMLPEERAQREATAEAALTAAAGTGGKKRQRKQQQKGKKAAAAGSQKRQQQQEDEEGEGEEDEAGEVQRIALARLLVWARWRQGEPFIVRGCEVSCQYCCCCYTSCCWVLLYM